MRFLLDENIDVRLVSHLQQLGHDATHIIRDYTPGIPDAQVLRPAEEESRILITNDKDFGELAYRIRRPGTSVILFRLGNYASLAT